MSNTTKIILSLCVSILTGWWIFSTIRFSEVTDMLMNVSALGIALFMMLSVLTSFFRYQRYKLLLAHDGYETGGMRLFLIVLIRNFCSDLLPARIGTLIYIPLVRSKLGVPLAAAASSYSSSFIFDFIGIVPVILFCLVVQGGEGAIPVFWMAVFSFAVLICSILALRILPAILKSRFIPSTFKDFALETATSILRSQQAKVLLPVFILSVLIRISKYFALYFFLLALLIPQGFTAQSMPFSTTFFGLISAELGASLPVSGIAGFGAYQGLWVFTFTLLGFPVDLAKLTSIAHHIFTQAWGYGIGIMALLVILCLPSRKRLDG